MPQIFKVGGYLVYFWTNENDPLEPLHVHVSEGNPSPNATKIWITHSGRCLLQNNKSNIPERQLRVIMQIIEARSFEIIKKITGTDIIGTIQMNKADKEGTKEN